MLFGETKSLFACRQLQLRLAHEIQVMENISRNWCLRVAMGLTKLAAIDSEEYQVIAHAIAGVAKGLTKSAAIDPMETIVGRFC